jgi:heme-degrading monooxygenase HmoA
MAETFWRAFTKPASNREYVAVLTYLPLKSLWAVPQFFFYSRRIQNQLKSARGLIGYSLLAHLLAKRFWTLSVWEDDIALARFIHRQPHQEAMAVMHRFMAGSEIIRWRVKGGAVPPTWSEAMRRFHENDPAK